MILAIMPGTLLRGVLFALLACSLLVNRAAAPAAFYVDDGAPLEEVDDEGPSVDGADGGTVTLPSAGLAELGPSPTGERQPNG